MFPKVSGNIPPMSEEGQRAAREFVAEELRRRPDLNRATLARTAGVDPKTLRAFLAGKRWPQGDKRKALSKALGWEPDEIDRIAATERHRRNIKYVDARTGDPIETRAGEGTLTSMELTSRFTSAISFATLAERINPNVEAEAAEFIVRATRLYEATTPFLDDREGGGGNAEDSSRVALSAIDDSMRDAIAAHEEEGSIAGEQEQPQEP